MLFGKTIHALENGLNYSTNRNRAISNNIANVDTPGYKAQRVSFEEHFQKATTVMQSKKTDERHVSFKGPQTPSFQIPKSPSYHHNGNGVDMDYEMSELAKNQIYYNTSVDLLNNKFRGLKQTIGSGR